MKPKYKGWKEGVIKETLSSLGTASHKKGDKVRYRKFKVYDDDGCATNEYEWHYIDLDNSNLIRTSQFLIQI